MENTIIQRIVEISKKEKLSINAFSSEIGVKQSTLATAISRDKGIGNEIIEKIVIAFPYISAEWLITGKGEMVKNETENKKENRDEIDFLRTQITEKDNIIKELLQTINKLLSNNSRAESL